MNETNDRQLTDLEQEFLDAEKEARPLIQEKLKAARKLIFEAEEISNRYGVPFRSEVSPLLNTYFPANSKFACEEMEDFVCWEIGWPEWGGWGGWEHSAVC